MGRKRSSSKSPLGFFAVLVAVAVAVGAGIWLTSRPNEPVPPAPGPTSKPSRPAVPPPSGDRRTVHVYVIKLVDDEPRLAPEARSVAADDDPHRTAIEKLLATNRETGPSKYLIPLGTKLRDIRVKDGIAYANFSREIQENFPGGSMTEALLVNSIVHTLRQFKDVEKVQILIEGKRVETLGGHLEILQPTTGDSTLLWRGDDE
ncbi:MAG: GerMN domain-containing protein [Armatimonadetes bacterium]|nr:GerMN domain-containing protein [Armatimonadota bacterium]